MANCLYWREDGCRNPAPCTWHIPSGVRSNNKCIMDGQLRDLKPGDRNPDLKQLGIGYRGRVTV